MRHLASISLSQLFASPVLFATVALLSACNDAGFEALDKARGKAPEASASLNTDDSKDSAGEKASESGEDKSNDQEPMAGKSEATKTEANPGDGRCDDKGEKIHISESDGVLTLDKSAAVDLHVSGSQNQVILNAKATEAGISSLCLKVTGNTNLLTVNVTGKVAGLTLDVSGNTANVKVNVPAGASLGGIDVKTRGSDAQVAIKGAGTFNCAAAKTDTKEGTYICEK